MKKEEQPLMPQSNSENMADKFFDPDLTTRERAAFELGIKLGALFHISMGIPISKDSNTLENIQNALESSIKTQPYVKKVKIRLKQKEIRGSKQNPYDYSIINSKNLYAEVILEYKDVHIEGRVEWLGDLQYPLMYINSCKPTDKSIKGK